MTDLTPEASRVLQEMEAELAAKRSASDQEVLSRADKEFGSDPVSRGLASMATGIAQAGFETKDFIFGEPEEGKKSQTRRDVEALDRALDNESVGYGLTSGVSQMVVGLIGAGKLLAPVKAAQKLKTAGKAGRAAYETGKAAAASAVVLDPHEERLSDLVESFPALQNPVTDYLASDIEDSAAEGRFKNAIESIGVDFALLGALKVIKLLRAGKQDAAAKEIAKLERARAANEDYFGMDFGPDQKEAPIAPQVAPVEAIDDQPTNLPDAAVKAPSEAPVAQPKEAISEQLGTKPLPVDPKTGEPIRPMQKIGPDEIRTQEISDADLDTILKASKSDSEAIAKFGSRDEAIANGHRFQKDAPLPWQKLRTTETSRALLQRTTEVLQKRFDRAKGGAVLKDRNVRQLVNDIANLYEEDPAFILGQLSEAGDDASKMVANMEASLRIGNKMFNDVDELAARIRAGSLQEFGGNTALAHEELKARLSVALDTLAAGNSILSNSGRSLRRARGQFRFRPKDLERLKSMDPEKLVVVMEKAGGDPRKVAMILDETWNKRVMDEVSFHLTNGLLWMWPTHLVNTTTNALMMVGRPTEKLFGSSALRLLTKDPARRAELSAVARQAKKEYLYTVTALSEGWTNAVEAFRRGDSILNPHNTEFFDVGVQTQELPWRPVQSINDIAYNAFVSARYRNFVGLPTRTLGAADEFFKTLRYRAVIQARAAVEASERGLSGKEAKAYIARSLNDSIDPATGRAVDANAIREAQSVSFQQDLNYETTIGGSFGRALQNARKTAPALGVVLPFVKTPVNVIRYGVKLTPGLNLLQKEFRDSLYGSMGTEAQAHAMGQMSLASMFGGLAAYLASTDQLTGAGPDDYKLKQELMATGWKPYSFKWEDENGDTKYLTLGRFDPMGMAFGMVADIVHLQKKNPEADYSELIGAAMIAVAKNLGEKTFLLNLNSAMEAFLDPENRLAKWTGRTAGSMLPFSSLMRGMNPDPYLREARGFIDSAMRGIPGLSDKLPLALDVFGDPIERFVGVVDTQKSGDIVEAEHNRIMLQTDKGIGKPDPKFEGVDLRDITLSDGVNAYQRYQELAGHLPGQRSLKSRLEDIIRSETYQDLPDGDSGVPGTRLNAIAKLVGKYRQQAKKVLLRQNPELRDLVKSRQREAHGAYLKNRESRREPGATELLNALRP
ncbi:hypothetical protein H7H48_15830 [Nitratireductor sp. B36]|uniref:hypothetical protein n=1 Tax=Nitratireductor sp. B36 TaxID=2762059 RepID=UPI001E4FDA64|nr:hypothetical protein [Nitratireductor sp. B36]MCC5780531.1 hypothetical protein [Nitratireductor sp. B36]